MADVPAADTSAPTVMDVESIRARPERPRRAELAAEQPGGL